MTRLAAILLITWFGLVTGATIVGVGMLKDLWTVEIIEETLEFCLESKPAKRTYST